MKRLCVICEGATEAEFINACLYPHLLPCGISIYPSILKTRPGQSGGGNVSLERLTRHIRNEYRHADFITTLVDYYGFKRRGAQSVDELEAAILESALCALSITDSRKLLPYVQQYEFEALLFSDIDAFHWVMEVWNQQVRGFLQAIVAAVTTPEDINDGRTTAPSKRLEAIFGKHYSKTEHGPLIAEEIGLARIRQCCPRFNQWLEKLEKLQ